MLYYHISSIHDNSDEVILAYGSIAEMLVNTEG